MSEFGDRPEKMIAAFREFDRAKKGRIPVALMSKILTTLGDKFTEEELKEFIAEADQGGEIDYVSFVKNVVFGSV